MMNSIFYKYLLKKLDRESLFENFEIFIDSYQKSLAPENTSDFLTIETKRFLLEFLIIGLIEYPDKNTISEKGKEIMSKWENNFHYLKTRISSAPKLPDAEKNKIQAYFESMFMFGPISAFISETEIKINEAKYRITEFAEAKISPTAGIIASEKVYLFLGDVVGDNVSMEK